MKRIGFFAVIGIFIFVSCKKEKIEALGPKEKNDTTVTNPPYWCVKSALLKRSGYPDRHILFEYNTKSQIISVKDNSLSTATFSKQQDTILTTYAYNGNKLVYKKMEKSTGEKLEEFRTYENDKIKKKEVTGTLGYYYYEDILPSTTVYEYVDNTISTKTLYQYDMRGTIGIGTVTTIFKDYADSSIAETNFNVEGFHSKEKLYKNNRKITRNKTTSSSFDDPNFINQDSIILSQKENRFNPIVWEYLNFNTYYNVIIGYMTYPVLLDLSNNKLFVDSRGSRGSKSKSYNQYDYDYENRVVKLLHGGDEITLTY